MSKIGKTPINISDQVKVEIKEQEVIVRGPMGELSSPLFPNITVEVIDNKVRVERKKNDQQTKSYHGLVRSLISNNIEGVTKGYKITLKLIGTGYRVKKKGQGLEMTLGFSHPVEFLAVPGINFEIEGEDTIHISSIDKQSIGQVAANIRKLKPPEPYKGKGIRYIDEVVKIKPGKTAVD